MSDEIKSLRLLHRGKVGDVYDAGEKNGTSLLLLVRSDRVSGLNVKLTTPMPGKGVVLNQMSRWWMLGPLKGIVNNHLTSFSPEDILTAEEAEHVVGRASVVKKLRPILVEAVVRRHITGTAYKSYLETGEVCGIKLPPGLSDGDRLDQPIFTPTEKSETDPSITFEQMCALIGNDLAEQVRTVSLAIFAEAERHLLPRGIIVADTKFEYGLESKNRLSLMDEVLTPDSSRFWLRNPLENVGEIVSLDKQKIRDWMIYQKNTGLWDGKSPLALPEYLVKEVSMDYKKILQMITT